MSTSLTHKTRAAADAQTVLKANALRCTHAREELSLRRVWGDDEDVSDVSCSAAALHAPTRESDEPDQEDDRRGHARAPERREPEWCC